MSRRFYSVVPSSLEDGPEFREHDTETEAILRATKALDWAAERARDEDEWLDNVSGICWGEVIVRARVVEHDEPVYSEEGNEIGRDTYCTLEDMEDRVSSASPAERDVLTRRAKQRAKWTNENDDGHPPGELALAAMILMGFPYAPQHWALSLRVKRLCESKGAAGGFREILVDAAALLVAEIDRLDRMGGVE